MQRLHSIVGVVRDIYFLSMILTINQYKLFSLSLFSSQRDLPAHGIHHRHPKESLSERQLTSLLNNTPSESLPNHDITAKEQLNE